MFVDNNSRYYQSGALDRQRDQSKFEVFLGQVLSVDFERMVVTIQDIRNNDLIYTEVAIFPAGSSSSTSTDVSMPEQFSTCLCANIVYVNGFAQIAVLSWTLGDAVKAIDAIAMRPLLGKDIQGLSNRLRGTYRKAYPGQKTASYTGGYTERIDTAWDRSSADYSRDRLDPERRTWTQITSRRVKYTDAGVVLEGPVNRPDATNLTKVVLPDGTFEYVAYLAPGAQPSDRYVSGKQDVIAFTENTELTQEFALDYPLPAELIQTDIFDKIVGTYQDPWQRTAVGAIPVAPATSTGMVKADDQTYMVDQTWDNPNNTLDSAVGPTLNEGITPRRRAFIIERTQGTLVGYNRFDKSTYGQVLKPVLFPYTQQGRFGTDVEAGYLPVKDSTDHVEARLAASALAIRFPYEYNTTRMDVTKEGFTSIEIGSTMPKENIQFAGGYEHPHGAGRSLELHTVGSVKAVIGKNRDEEDAIDLQALGQAVIRLGADDTSLPNSRRTVETQIRSKGDAVAARTLQYWTAPKLAPGDAGNLANKTGAENVSLRAALDGGTILRLGAKNPQSLRRHLINGYSDAQGKSPYAVGDSSRIDSRSPGRPTYGAGDNLYQFHDMTQVGSPQLQMLPYNWSGSPVNTPDAMGLSLDVHANRDVLLRLGQNPDSGQSLLIDLAGGVVLAFGKDSQGRSITGQFDGGVEVTLKPNTQGKALRLEIQGDVDITHKGNLHWHSTGDWITECSTWRHATKTDIIFTAQKIQQVALARHTTEAPDIVHNQGLYESDENS